MSINDRFEPQQQQQEPYVNPMFSDAEGEHTLYPPITPVPAWTRDGGEMIPIIALPFHDFTVIDYDGDAVSLNKTRVIAWVKTDRGWQAIYEGIPETVHVKDQDPLYLQLAVQKQAWCLRARSRDGQKARTLRVLDNRAAATVAQAWMLHDSPVICAL